jgi:MFS transporter, MHS family, proline/betaine transporter
VCDGDLSSRVGVRDPAHSPRPERASVTSASRASAERALLRAIVAGNCGNVLEWYDFVVFAFLAPVIGARFFPSGNPLSSLLNAFGVFAVGYLVRPVGGLLFGQLGDRHGRKRALQLSVVAMAIPTALIAALPTYADIGILAPVLLVLLRLAQGGAIGGELVGSMCYLVEAAPPGRRALFGSLTIVGIALGVLLASGVVAIARALMPSETMHARGWRLPFLGGLVIGAVGWWMRRGLAETPAFLRAAEAGRTADASVAALLHAHGARIAVVFGMSILAAVGFYTLFAWMPAYLGHIVRPPIADPVLINTAATAVVSATMPLAGWLADRVGWRRVLIGAGVVYAAAVVPAFRAIDTGSVAAATGAVLAISAIHAFSNGPLPAALSDLLPTEVRYSGIALGYNLAFAVFGGTAPLVATWLIQSTGDLAAPAWYLCAAAVVTIAVTLVAARAAGSTGGGLGDRVDARTDRPRGTIC